MLSDSKLLDRKSYTNLQNIFHGFFNWSSFFSTEKKVRKRWFLANADIYFFHRTIISLNF